MKEFEKIQEADWVVAPRELAAPVITRRFYVGAAGRAELQISALGFMIPYELPLAPISKPLENALAIS